jgi:hypothetical protein
MKSDTLPSPHDSGETHRRTFLRYLAGVGIGVATIPILTQGKEIHGSGSREHVNVFGAGRRLMILLRPEPNVSKDSSFITTCRDILKNQAGAGSELGLDQTIVRLSHPYQIYFKNVAEAARWLDVNGYRNALDYYVKHGGRMLVIFNELNSLNEPQYWVSRRSLAYLSFAIRRTYSNRGQRLLYTMFPGPSEGLGPNNFLSYFRHYDLLTHTRTPKTFGEVFGKHCDPLIYDKTMLNYSGKGVFDRIALRYDPINCIAWDGCGDNSEATSYLKWAKANVDDAIWLYQVEMTDAGKTKLQKDTKQWKDYAVGKALAPFNPTSTRYHIHVV